MNSVLTSNQEAVDNSDHAEMQRWIDDNDELTEQERSLLREAAII
jgi:hypothetical protein